MSTTIIRTVDDAFLAIDKVFETDSQPCFSGPKPECTNGASDDALAYSQKIVANRDLGSESSQRLHAMMDEMDALDAMDALDEMEAH